jgi:hypothetical protein
MTNEGTNNGNNNGKRVQTQIACGDDKQKRQNRAGNQGSPWMGWGWVAVVEAVGCDTPFDESARLRCFKGAWMVACEEAKVRDV